VKTFFFVVKDDATMILAYLQFTVNAYTMF